MEKLGLVITKTYGGYAIVFEKNTIPQWVNSIGEVGNLCPSDPNERTIFLRYVETGVLVGLIRDYNGGMAGDNFTAWIHVPSELQISGEELLSIIDVLDEKFKSSDYDFSSLAELLDKEYPVISAKRVVTVSQGNLSAVKFFGDASLYKWALSDVLDSKYLFQPEYQKYRYVIFLDDKERSSRYPHFECIADLPSHKESIIINPPAEKDGFIPYVKDEPFSNPILANKGEIVNIVWKKADYKDVVAPFTASESPVPPIDKKDYLRRVNPAKIHVNSKNTGNVVKQAKVFVQGRPLKEGEDMYLPEYQYTRADILVQHPYYEDCRVNGRNLEEDIIICLEDKFFTYNFTIAMKNSTEVVDITVPSKTILMETPFEGYVLANSNLRPSLNEINRLKYKPEQGISKTRLIVLCVLSLLVGLLVGVGIMLLVGYNTEIFQEDDPAGQLFPPVETKDSLVAPVPVKKDTVKKSEAAKKPAAPAPSPTSKKDDAPKVVVTPADAMLISDAITYLNSNEVWDRNQMETYPKLKGLWDALNNKKFKDISTKYKYLMSSPIFKSIVEAAGKCGELSTNPYNSPDDWAITPARYLEYLTSRAAVQE